MNSCRQDYRGIFRKFTGKKILSDIRAGDYAHAGEEEAICKVFDRFEKGKGYQILDVGCGLGGSANFIQEMGWGSVTGFDIEEESIAYAKNKYQNVDFFVGDAADESSLCNVLNNRKFDIICILHALCIIPRQQEVLRAVRKFAHDETVLVIFEYDDLTNGNSPLKFTESTGKYFNVLARSEFKHMLSQAGWLIDDANIFDYTSDFERWYERMVMDLRSMIEVIIARYGEDYFYNAEKRYGGILNAIKQNKLGGCVIYAPAA